MPEPCGVDQQRVAAKIGKAGVYDYLTADLVVELLIGSQW